MAQQAFAAAIALPDVSHTIEKRGGFQGTCQDSAISGTTLTAECKNRNGAWGATSVDLNACANNNNGAIYVS